jgi:hypothetical protein
MQQRCWHLEMADPKKRLIQSDRGLSDLEISKGDGGLEIRWSGFDFDAKARAIFP